MIRCHLARMMGEHKMRIADVARKTGLSRATITLLYKETAQKVDLESIEKLCLLFECQVGDLLELTQQKQACQFNDNDHFIKHLTTPMNN